MRSLEVGSTALALRMRPLQIRICLLCKSSYSGDDLEGRGRLNLRLGLHRPLVKVGTDGRVSQLLRPLSGLQSGALNGFVGRRAGIDATRALRPIHPSANLPPRPKQPLDNGTGYIGPQRRAGGSALRQVARGQVLGKIVESHVHAAGDGQGDVGKPSLAPGSSNSWRATVTRPRAGQPADVRRDQPLSLTPSSKSIGERYQIEEWRRGLSTRRQTARYHSVWRCCGGLCLASLGWAGGPHPSGN